MLKQTFKLLWLLLNGLYRHQVNMAQLTQNSLLKSNYVGAY